MTFKQAVEAWLLDKQERVVAEKHAVLKNRTERFWFPSATARCLRLPRTTSRGFKRRKAGLFVVLG
jgi:hypothetical protein